MTTTTSSVAVGMFATWLSKTGGEAAGSPEKRSSTVVPTRACKCGATWTSEMRGGGASRLSASWYHRHLGRDRCPTSEPSHLLSNELFQSGSALLGVRLDSQQRGERRRGGGGGGTSRVCTESCCFFRRRVGGIACAARSGEGLASGSGGKRGGRGGCALSRPSSCSSSSSSSLRRPVINLQKRQASEGAVVSEAEFEAVMKGSSEVLSMLKDMRALLKDLYIGEDNSEGEGLMLSLAATSIVGSRVDSLEPGFLVALDAMIRKAEAVDKDPKAVQILTTIKEQVLQHLKQRFPSQLQVVDILCRTSSKVERKELLCRAISGGGIFDVENGGKLRVPEATLENIQRQADDLIADIEERPKVLDRRLLARLVLIREEARSLLAGGVLDERASTRGFTSLPEPEVKFISKLVAMRPGKGMRVILRNVLEGRDEGADKPEMSLDDNVGDTLKDLDNISIEDLSNLAMSEKSGTKTKQRPKPVVLGTGPGPGWSGRKAKPKSKSSEKLESLPVRPGQFLDSVKKGDPQPKVVCIGGGRVAVGSVGSIYKCGASAGPALNPSPLLPWVLALPPRFGSMARSHQCAISIIPPFFTDVLEGVQYCGDRRQSLQRIGGGDSKDDYDKRSRLEVTALPVGRVTPRHSCYVARVAGKPSRTPTLKAPASTVGVFQCHHESFHGKLGGVCGHRRLQGRRAISVLCMAIERHQGGGGYAVAGGLGNNGGRDRDGVCRILKQVGATRIPVDASQGVWMSGNDGDEGADEWDFLSSPYSFGQDEASSGSSRSPSPLPPPPPALLTPPPAAAEPTQPVKLRKLKFGQLRKLKELPLRETVSPVRAVAAVRLLRVEDGGAFVDLMGGDGGTGIEKKEMETVVRALGFRVNPLDERGQRQMTEIVAGVSRWKRYLDFLLECFHKGTPRELERMEPMLRQIIRIGLFELVKLNEAPHVAVHQAVELAKFALRDGAGKKTNGILRAALRAKEIGRLPIPSAPIGADDEETFASGLAIMHSHPTWLVKRWLTQFGEEETVKLLQWNNSRPTFGLRANTIKRMDRDSMQMVLESLGVQCKLSPYIEDFVRLQSGMQAILASPLLKEGFCAVQDESAGLMMALLDPKPGDVVVDCCAAPGGKALYAAARLKGKGKVIAVDVHVGRMRTLRKNAHTLGVGKWVETFVADAQRFAAQAAVTADKVLVDAPCSGVGVLSKRADLRWRRKVERLDEMLKLQDNLLNSAVRMLNPGGVLVYSTCSIEPQENEQRIAEFLRRHKDFVVESAADFVPADVVTPDGFVAVYPQRHGVDGAFGARLRKLKNRDRETNGTAQQEKKTLAVKQS